MNYEIVDFDINSLLKINLNKSESVIAEAGSMMYMKNGINIRTEKHEEVSYTSLHHYAALQQSNKSEFLSEEDNGEIMFSPSSPGKILHFELNNTSICSDSLSFLCCTSGLKFTQKGSIDGLLSGAGLFKETFTGNGHLFLKCFGDFMSIELKEGEKISIDTGHLLAHDESVDVKILKSDGDRFDSFAEGEILVCEFTGPGKVWLQSRNRSEFAKVIQTFLPKRKISRMPD